MRTQSAAQPDFFPLAFRPLSFAIVPRSATSLFEYLGLLLKVQTQHIVPSSFAYISPRPKICIESAGAGDRTRRSKSSYSRADDGRPKEPTVLRGLPSSTTLILSYRVTGGNGAEANFHSASRNSLEFKQGINTNPLSA